jgi:hypothetical protein
MKSGISRAHAKLSDLPRPTVTTADDRRAAVEVFELWQHQWPTLFRGEAWLHMERLKEAVSQGR